MYRPLKNIIDRITSLVLIIMLSPLVVFLILLVALQNMGNPIFTQIRTGENGNLFKIYKLKTMLDTLGEDDKLLPDYERITPLGKFIRKLSLDELPQLLNVFFGQMSFVGPRPLLPEYLPLYSKEQNRRHEVKPGITGWAQVNGRNTISWQEKFKLDVHYVEHQSFFLDIKILFMTVGKVFLPKDINAGEQLTMEAFNGKN